jgi:hypothetical protein
LPIKSRSNNRILPQNSRAVDVARRAMADLVPAQQRKYANAFEVNGHESVIYNRLSTGTPCSCMAHRQALGALLDEEGKMPQGTMNQLLTGGMQFRVNRYGERSGTREDLRAARGEDPVEANTEAPQNNPLLPGARRLPDADYVAINLDDEVATTFENQDAEGINGNVRAQTIDDLVADFDTDVSLSDSSCTVCYGTGFVGGFTVQGGWRLALSTQWENLEVTGLIEPNQTPHKFLAQEVVFTVVFPKGFVYLDAFRFWNNKERVTPHQVLLDNLAYTPQLFAALCDGREHTITVRSDHIPEYWTHLEIQVCQTTHASLLEFPKLTKGSDTTKLDPTQDVQLLASPLVPYLNPGDVIVESTNGKPFKINNTTPWNDRNRNVLGWNCNARVIQPEEMLALLPRRRKLGQRTTNAVRDNVDQNRRT